MRTSSKLNALEVAYRSWIAKINDGKLNKPRLCDYALDQGPERDIALRMAYRIRTEMKVDHDRFRID